MLLLLVACDPVINQRTVYKTLERNGCIRCHGAVDSGNFLSLCDLRTLPNLPSQWPMPHVEPIVMPGNADGSFLLRKITGPIEERAQTLPPTTTTLPNGNGVDDEGDGFVDDTEGSLMPKDLPPMSLDDVTVIRFWINRGAVATESYREYKTAIGEFTTDCSTAPMPAVPVPAKAEADAKTDATGVNTPPADAKTEGAARSDPEVAAEPAPIDARPGKEGKRRGDKHN